MPEALLRALDLSIGRRVEGLLAGDYRSSLHGEGSELALVRPYVAGDDVRRIDWNVTARTNEPHVRVTLAERVLVSWLVLDTSTSMQFGTADRRKADVAEGVAIAVGHLATRRGNRLGVVTLRRFEPAHASAAPGTSRTHRTADGASRKEPDEAQLGPTSLGEAVARTNALARQRSLVVVVSDFRGRRDWRRKLLELASRHDVIAVEIRDPREQELTDVGVLWLVDPETGKQLRVDTRSERLRERFAAAASSERLSRVRRARLRGRSPRHPDDRRRLASRPRGVPAPETAMTGAGETS